MLESHHVLLGAMGDDELRRVIEEPARHAGLQIEAGLTDLMLRDISGEPGGLPLLSHALLETWRRRHGRILTVDGYRAAGGVRGAIARTADDVFDALDAAGQLLAHGVFVRLTELGEGTEDTRRRVPRAELLPQSSDPAALDRVVESLTAARLLTVGDDTVEVAHEALIREWPRLRAWLDDDRDALRTLRHLAGAARDWDQRGRNDDDVYRGPRLAAAIELAEHSASTDLTALERDYLDAGRLRLEREQRQARRQVRRLQRALAAALVAVLVAGATGVVALNQRNRANGATRDAELRGLVSESRGLLSQNRSLALLLAAEAYRRTPDANARDALLGAVLAEPRLQATFGPTAGVIYAGLLTGTRVAVAADPLSLHGHDISVWNWNTGRQVAWSAAPRASAGRGCARANPVGLATSADGERMAVVTADGRLHLFSGRTLRAQGEPEETGLDFASCEARVAFSPNGRWLAISSGRWNLHDKFTGKTVGLFERTGDGWRTGPTLTGHQIRVDALAFSKDNSILATGSPNGTDPETDPSRIVLHDVHTGKTVGTIEASNDLFSLALDWDRHRVVAGNYGIDPLFVYDLHEPFERTTKRDLGAAALAVYNADWTQLATSGPGGFQLFDAASLEPKKGSGVDPKAGGGSLVFLPHGQILLAGNTGPTTVWDLGSTSVLQTVIPQPGFVLPTAMPDVFIASKSTSEGASKGSFITILGPGPDYQPLRDEIRVGAPGTFPPTWCADPHTNRIATVGTGSRADKGDIVVWRGVPPFDVMSRTRGVVEFEPLFCEWRPDGKQIVIGGTGGTGGEVALYQIATGDIQPVPAHLHAFPTSLAYRPDSKVLWVASSSPGEFPARITNLDSTLQVTFPLPVSTALRFTPDGRFLVTADTTSVQVLDADSLKPVTDHIPATTNLITVLAVSPDGHSAVTSDLQGLVQRIDLRAGRTIGPPIPILFPGPAVFGRDDTTIYASTPDGRATVWDFAPDHVRDEACVLAGRNLTQAEWHHYLPWAGPRRATCAQFP